MQNVKTQQQVISKTVFLLEISCIKMNMLYTFLFFLLIIHKYPGTVILFHIFFFLNNSVHKADMINPF